MELTLLWLVSGISTEGRWCLGSNLQLALIPLGRLVSVFRDLLFLFYVGCSAKSSLCSPGGFYSFGQHKPPWSRSLSPWDKGTESLPLSSWQVTTNAQAKWAHATFCARTGRWCKGLGEELRVTCEYTLMSMSWMYLYMPAIRILYKVIQISATNLVPNTTYLSISVIIKKISWSMILAFIIHKL